MFLVQTIYIPIMSIKSDQMKTKDTVYSINGQEQFIIHKTNRNKGLAVILCLFLICTGTMKK